MVLYITNMVAAGEVDNLPGYFILVKLTLLVVPPKILPRGKWSACSVASRTRTIKKLKSVLQFSYFRVAIISNSSLGSVVVVVVVIVVVVFVVFTIGSGMHSTSFALGSEVMFTILKRS